MSNLQTHEKRLEKSVYRYLELMVQSSQKCRRELSRNTCVRLLSMIKDEEAVDAYSRQLRFDINLPTKRFVEATNGITGQPATRHLRIGYFGASTGAAGALIAAVDLPNTITKWLSARIKKQMAATHLFEEPGTLEQVAQLASTWFKNKLQPRASADGT